MMWLLYFNMHRGLRHYRQNVSNSFCIIPGSQTDPCDMSLMSVRNFNTLFNQPYQLIIFFVTSCFNTPHISYKDLSVLMNIKCGQAFRLIAIIISFDITLS